MGLILPELLAQLSINPGWVGESHFHMKKYEMEFIGQEKNVQLSPVNMSKIISLMFFLIHDFYLVTVLERDHEN